MRLNALNYFFGFKEGNRKFFKLDFKEVKGGVQKVELVPSSYLEIDITNPQNKLIND